MSKYKSKIDKFVEQIEYVLAWNGWRTIRVSGWEVIVYKQEVSFKIVYSRKHKSILYETNPHMVDKYDHIFNEIEKVINPK